MSEQEHAGANPWLVLFGLSLGVLVTNGFGRFAYGLILPAMRADLGWTYAQAGWLNTANALGIAILFGSGGGSAIVLVGATLPPMLDSWGDASWPWAWVLVGGLSLICVPMGLWSARASHAPVARGGRPAPLPLRRMWPELAGYAGFGLGYIVYLTFLSSWMKEQQASALQVALIWVLVGSCITVSPMLWRGVFARHASGLPLALVLSCIALGSALPVLWPGTPGLVLSALVFGGSVFMAPPAVTNFTRKNLPPEAWGRAIGLFTVVFAFAQTAGPYAAGALGDRAGSIGVSLLAAAGILLAGAAVALRQRPL